MSKEERPTFQSIPLRRSATYQTRHTTTEQERSMQAPRKSSYVSRAAMPPMPDDEQVYQPTRVPSSARRYRETEKREQILRRGNQELVVRKGRPTRRVHWLVPATLGMAFILLVLLCIVWAVGAWQEHQLSATYGYPRTWQTNANVGHGSGESHFIFENLYGHIFFEEIPNKDDFQHAIIYPVMVLHGENADSVPVTAIFKDINGDGRIDILISVGDQEPIVFLNNGTKFVPEQ